MDCSCGARAGGLHDWFCSKELCPYCQGQLASCSCIETVLALTPKEIVAVREYVDDTVEPLQSVIKRWREALDKKVASPGRRRSIRLSDSKERRLIASRSNGSRSLRIS